MTVMTEVPGGDETINKASAVSAVATSAAPDVNKKRPASGSPSMIQLLFFSLIVLAATIQFWIGFEHQSTSSAYLANGNNNVDAMTSSMMMQTNNAKILHLKDFLKQHKMNIKAAGSSSSSKPNDKGQQQTQQQPWQNITIYCILPYVWTPASQAKRIEILNTWGRRCNKISFLIDPIVMMMEQQQKGNQKTTTETYLDATHWKHDDKSKSIASDKRLLTVPTSTTSQHTLPADVHVITDMTRAWHNCTNSKSGKKANECRNIWEKIWRSIVWVNQENDDNNNQHTQETYDWYIKTDWDAYVFVDHIRHYVHTKGYNGKTQEHFLGHQDLHKKNKPFISGALQIFSAKAFHQLAQTLRRMPKAVPGNITEFTGERICRDGAGLADFPTALCLQQGSNVTSEHTRDEQERERVLLFPPEDLLTFNRTEQGEWWYWGGKPKNVGQMENCCSPLPLAFHSRNYKRADLGHYYKLEHDLYGYKHVPTTIWDPHKYPKHKRQALLDTYLKKIKVAMQREHLVSLPPIRQWVG